MIIDRVHIAHAMRHELVVKARPEFRAHFHPKRDDPRLCAREQHEQRRPIVAREINAGVEFAARDCERGLDSGEAARHGQKFVHPLNRGSERFALGRNDQRDSRVGKFRARRRDRRRGQYQIADPFELKKENVQLVRQLDRPLVCA